MKSSLEGVQWKTLRSPASVKAFSGASIAIPVWICIAPIWILPEYFDLLGAHGVRRIVVLSSTSRFTKSNSADTKEQELAFRLADAEMKVQQWADLHHVEWIILRPTLIYGFGRDKNISEIARFIRQFSFFPLFGGAIGLRQPVHATDVAGACYLALRDSKVRNRAYDISGGEILSYREMVLRVFVGLDRQPRLITIPLWVFDIGLFFLRWFPRYHKWSSGMAVRMNQDMVFDHGDAVRDFGYAPRAFSVGIKAIDS